MLADGMLLGALRSGGRLAALRSQGTLVALALLAQLSPLCAGAFETHSLSVQREGARYVVDLSAYLDAPADQVGAVLTDYEGYPQLDARILESRREESEPAKLHTRLRGCVGALLCRTMRRVETLQEAPGSLIATALPEQSDVKYGLTHSYWTASAGGTQVQYRLEIEPDFWVPPIIGPPLMIRTLREGTLSLFANVERAANARAAARGVPQADAPVVEEPSADEPSVDEPLVDETADDHG